jgi:chromosome partitioning protein
MSKTIAISNHKGGVGKTTSAINIGAAMNRAGKKVLLIDLDPQANLTQSLHVNSEQNVYGSMRGQYPLKPVEVLPGFDVVPSTLDLSGAEIELSSEAGREFVLDELLTPFRNLYDYILIDSAPSLGLLTINAFTAADYVLIPLQAQYLATQGMVKLIEVIEKIQKRLNKRLKLAGIFITQYDHRKVLNRDIFGLIENHFHGKVLASKIRDNVALAEAPTAGQDIFRYNPKSNGADDYQALTAEIMKTL